MVSLTTLRNDAGLERGGAARGGKKLGDRRKDEGESKNKRTRKKEGEWGKL